MNDRERKDDVEIDYLKRDVQALDGRISELSVAVENIRDNHLAHIGADIGALKIQTEKTQTNQEWLMRYHWITATASIGAVITGLVNLAK